jgi:hypothetical protein
VSREHLSLYSDNEIIWNKYYSIERCKNNQIVPSIEVKEELLHELVPNEIIQETHKGTIPKGIKKT